MDGTELIDRTGRLLTYLAAVARELTVTPVRDVAHHRGGTPVWPDQVPMHPKVRLGPTASRPEWLSVGKVAEPQPPQPPVRLADLIDPATVDAQAVPAFGPAADALDEQTRQPLDDLLREWLDTTWRPWVRDTEPARMARRLYDALFTIELLASRTAATDELVWGHTLCSWQVGTAAVRYPLLITPVRIEIDEDDGTLRVVPDDAPEMQLDPLEGLGLPAVDDLVKVAARVRDDPPDVWSIESLAAVQQQTAAVLGLDAVALAAAAPPPPGPAPVITDGWVLFLRPRPTRYDRFYRELADVLASGDVVPQALAAMVADEEAVQAAMADLGVDDDTSWRQIGRQLLMPLPANEEQERIVRQLSRERGVTVQGPPGTGKTHTIANLISHLLANGKRVLVTAQNEQALAVVRDKIPAELRDLSIAVLDSSAEALTQLRAAAQAVMDVAARTDLETEEPAIRRRAVTLEELRERLRRTELAMIEAMRAEDAEFDLGERRLRAPDLARWLAEHPDRDRISDPLPADLPLPLDSVELCELYELSASIATADAVALAAHRPGLDQLPPSAELSRQVDRRDRLRQDLADLEQQGLDLTAVDAATEADLDSRAQDAARAADRLRGLEQPWPASIRAQMRTTPEGGRTWAAHVGVLNSQLGAVSDLERQLVGRRVVVPDGDPRIELELLDQLRARYAAGKGLPLVGGGAVKDLHRQVLVDGLNLQTAAEVDLAHAAVRHRVELRRLLQLIGDLTRDTPLSLSGLAEVAAAVRVAVDAVRWEERDAAELTRTLGPFLRTFPAAVSAADLDKLAAMLTQAARRKEERQLTAGLQRLGDWLQTGAGSAGASPLWSRLRTALDAGNWAAWNDTVDEVARFAALDRPAARRADLAGRLAHAAPDWAAAIIRTGGHYDTVGRPDEAEQLWQWRQAATWLDALLARGDLGQLQGEVRRLQREETAAVLDIARRGAAVGLRRNLTDRSRRALSGWLGALTKQGKGTGKYAPFWQAQARAQLPAAMGAVPVWIMPIHRVIENFDPRVADLFDVIIVDESSQCDLLSLGVLALGSKSVVVGDDQQTSPAAVGVDRQRIMQLQERYLPDIPGARLLTADESLYAISERIFPSTILLREHFRCVPEIIDFSNRYYDGKILPLREPSAAQIGPPLRCIQVHEGARTGSGAASINRAEAVALADQVAKCAVDPRYDGLTFGVVTLLGNGQGPLLEGLIRDRIGVQEFHHRRLRVGNPAVFQGDERNVVFISVVADDNSYAATKRSEAQRVNVAASRAQDQLWVFHTVDPSTLHPDDHRRALIEYVRDAVQIEKKITDLAGRCESKFEQDVLRDLLGRGYQVDVQHQVGRYRIDLVVRGDLRRLAIECDGDRYHGPEQWADDIRRQRQLERIGWMFWRIKASEYYRERPKVLADLGARLSDLAIAPSGSSPTGPRGTIPAPDVATPPAAERVSPTVAPVVADEPRGGAAARGSQPVMQPPMAMAATPPTDGPAAKTGNKVTPVQRTTETARRPPARTATRPSVEPSRATRGRPVPTSDTAALAPQQQGFAPVPDGYRQVGWIRPHEAAAVAEAYRLQHSVDVVDGAGRVAGRAVFHPAEHPDAVKFRAQVALHRSAPSGGRVVGWLRRHEAAAVLQADKQQTEVAVEPTTTESGCLVQYYPPDSREAATFRSPTRLCRRRPTSA